MDDITRQQADRLVAAMGGTFPRLYLVGCEPAELGPEDDGLMGLSKPVQAAVGKALDLLEALIAVTVEPCRA